MAMVLSLSFKECEYVFINLHHFICNDKFMNIWILDIDVNYTVLNYWYTWDRVIYVWVWT